MLVDASQLRILVESDSIALRADMPSLLKADWSLDQKERAAQRAKREHFKSILDQQVASNVKSVDVMTAAERAMNRQLLSQQQTSIL